KPGGGCPDPTARRVLPLWSRGVGSNAAVYGCPCAAGGDAGHAGQATAGARLGPSTAGNKRSLPPVERRRADVDQLTAAMPEAPHRAAGGSVLEVQRDLDDAK